MKQVLGPLSFTLPERPFAGMVGVLGLFECAAVDGSRLVSCHFFPTHSPNPSLAPLGERGGLHVAACFKAGTLRFTACWPQSGGNSATSRCSRIRPRISSPSFSAVHLSPFALSLSKGCQASTGSARTVMGRCLNRIGPILDFSICRPETAHSNQALSQRQLAPTCLHQIQNPRTQFDGNAPMRTFFPPSKTRPNVAVSSLSAPAGVERVGERGGIQRKKNKNAADNQFGNSSHDHPRVRKILQKQEHTSHIPRGLTVKTINTIGQFPQTVTKELTA